MIDWSQVAQLRDDVGVEDFDDVLDIFFEEVEEVTARLAAQEIGRETALSKRKRTKLGLLDVLGCMPSR